MGEILHVRTMDSDIRNYVVNYHGDLVDLLRVNEPVVTHFRWT